MYENKNIEPTLFGNEYKVMDLNIDLFPYLNMEESTLKGCN